MAPESKILPQPIPKEDLIRYTQAIQEMALSDAIRQLEEVYGFVDQARGRHNAEEVIQALFGPEVLKP